jgi:aquaporin Z
MRKLLTEFIGTFFLVLTIGLSVLGGAPMPPIAIGAMLMVMVYMGGHISGGHYNPAVSLAAAAAGKLAVKDLAPYWGSQLAGGLAAAFAVKTIMARTIAPAPSEAHSALAAWLVEILYTFALALVVLNTATSKKTQGNSYFGLAIGFTVAAAAAAGGGVSGGAFNPAVGTGLIVVQALAGAGGYGHLPLYWLAPLAGAALAALVFRFQEA